MLNEARSSLYSHPSLLIYPGSCILVTAAGFNLFGEALRDTLLPEEENDMNIPATVDIRNLCVMHRKSGYLLVDSLSLSISHGSSSSYWGNRDAARR